MTISTAGYTKRGAWATLLVSVALILMTLSACDSKSGLSEAAFMKRANEDISAGKLKAAVIELKNALQRNPRSAAARLKLGEVYIDVGDGASAEKELQRAQSLGAAADSTLVPLGKAYLLQAKFKDILKDVPIPEGTTPDQKAVAAEVQTLHGMAYLGLSRPEDAVKAFRAALELSPDFSGAYVGLARLAMAEANMTEAKANLAKAEQSAPKDWDVLILKGDILFGTQDYAGSEAAFKELDKIRPESIIPHLGLARAEIGLGKLKEAVTQLDAVLKVVPNQPSANYFRAVAAYQQKHYKTAQSYVENVLKFSPNEPAAVLLAGAAAYGAHTYEQAVKYLSQFLSSYPDHAPARRLLASAQVALGRNDDAVKTLEPLAKEQPKDADLLKSIGVAAVRGGDYKTAKAYYERALALNPNDAKLRAQLGATKIALGEKEQGLEDIEKAIQLDPSLTGAEMAVAVTHLRAGEYDKALASAKALEAKLPDKPQPHTLEGLALLGLGKEAEAKAAFEEALKIHPGDPDAANNLAVLAVRKGNVDTARKYLQDAVDKNPGQLQSLLRLAQLEAATGKWDKAGDDLQQAVKSNPDSPVPRAFLGQYMIARGQPLKAISIAQEGLQKFDNNLALVEVLGRAQLAAGQSGDAVGTFSHLSQLKPDAADYQFLLATAYEANGNLLGMKNALQQSMELNPNYLPPRIAMARYDIARNKLDDAKTMLADLQKSNADNLDVMALSGTLAMAEKRPKDAVTVFKKIADVRPNSQTEIRLATAQWEAGDRDDAVGTLQAWTKKAPKDDMAAWRLSGFYQDLNKLDEAKKLLTEIVDRSPKNWMAQNDLAWVMLRQGDGTDAQPHAQKAYDLEPKNPNTADTLGMVLLKNGEKAKAVRLIQQAVDGAPSRPDLQFHLAKARAENGEPDLARGILRRILSKDEPFKERDEAKALLQQLGG